MLNLAAQMEQALEQARAAAAAEIARQNSIFQRATEQQAAAAAEAATADWHLVEAIGFTSNFKP